MEHTQYVEVGGKGRSQQQYPHSLHTSIQFIENILNNSRQSAALLLGEVTRPEPRLSPLLLSRIGCLTTCSSAVPSRYAPSLGVRDLDRYCRELYETRQVAKAMAPRHTVSRLI